MKFIRIKAGTFLMGSTGAEIKTINQEMKATGIKHWADSEGPQCNVTLMRDYFLGECEVTRGQFRKFVTETGYTTECELDGKGGTILTWSIPNKIWLRDPQYTWRNPGFTQTDEHPVVQVTWNDAMAFCQWLGRKEGRSFRLPTEAEWEHACRAGTSGKFHFGNENEALRLYANVADASFRAATAHKYGYGIQATDGYGFTAPVRQFRPNAFGLYDMHGNVNERCLDRNEAYDRMESDPARIIKQSDGRHSVRGGGWNAAPGDSRAAHRFVDSNSGSHSTIGFRVCFHPHLEGIKNDLDDLDKLKKIP